MSAVAQIFRRLEGRWKFKRAIPEHGTVEGLATFEKLNDDSTNVLRYKEDGTFQTLEKKVFNVSREYEYRLNDEKISVYLENRLLHDLEFKTPVTAVGTHLCGGDVYDATYDFVDSQNFELVYRVIGSNKNYSIHTTFTRS